jgi:hypothetical protein
MLVEWVPREINAFANAISKWLIPDDYYISRFYVIMLDYNWGPHITCDIFLPCENNHYSKFYSIHRCRGTSGVHGFGFDWSIENCWIHAPIRLIKKIWRKLGEQGDKATIVVPLWLPGGI